MAFTEGVLHIAMMSTVSEFLSPVHYCLIGHFMIKEGSGPVQVLEM